MYLRFVVSRINKDSAVREGLFRTAYALKREGQLPPADARELEELLGWLDEQLKQPDRFNSSTSKGHYRRASRGIAWLKPTAALHVEKMRSLAILLELHGHATEMIKSDRPGYIVYEDEAQVIAEPFRDTRT